MTKHPSPRPLVVIGAGLSGLVTASILRSRGLDALVLEARDRPGGRIHTVSGADGRGAFDRGATWFGPKHAHLVRIAESLGVVRFEQFHAGGGLVDLGPRGVRPLDFPPPPEPTFRFRGGSRALIDALVTNLEPARIRYGTHVMALRHRPGAIEIDTADADGRAETLAADRVVTTLPPRLLARSVDFEPELPPAVAAVLAGTPTWMGHAVKFWARYETPFWRERGGGFGVAHAGIVEEVHDHSGDDDATFALTGFLRPGAHLEDPTRRDERTLEHLARFFGPAAAAPLEFDACSWPHEVFSSDVDAKAVPVGTKYGDPRLWVPQFGGRLLFSGTETSREYGGYMEGAVISGLRAAAWATET